MACRVGMSTTPWDRIDYWKRRELHTHGEVLAPGLTYEGAQRREEIEAAARGCHAEHGGQYVAGPVWSVYLVSGGFIS